MATRRSRRQGIDTVEQRGARAERLVQLGEISVGRQALESGKVAPGTLATLRALTDPARRPPVPREPLPEALLTMRPSILFELDADRFMSNIRVARRGAAPGPSGLTAEHLLPVLDNDAAVGALFQVADLLANGFIPPDAHAAIRLGRITALEKPSGGIRGIVVGDFFRRLVARTIAQQVSEDVEKATKPFQFALNTRAGCECVSHVLQTLLEMDENTTLLSVDGVGAFDLISRKAMMEGLLDMPNGDKLLPFVRLFYGSPSTFLWEDEMGTVNFVPQGEGGGTRRPVNAPPLLSWTTSRSVCCRREVGSSRTLGRFPG